MSQGTNHGRFAWHELMTGDPAGAEQFYRDVIGWTTQRSDMGPMEYTLWLADGVPVGGLMKMHGGPEMPPHWLAYTEVDDVDATVGEATKRGGKVLAPVQTVPGAGRFAVLQDPQGAVFAVITSENAPQPETDPRPLEFSWHELQTTDFQGAVDFYSAIFGWKKQDEMDMGAMGTYYMYGRDRFTYGGMMRKPPEVAAPPFWTHYIQTRDSADAAVERAKARGAKPIMGPMEVPGGDRVAILFDPQGAAFAVHSKAAVAAPAGVPGTSSTANTAKL